METKLFNFRLSIELMTAVKAKAGKTGMTDVVTSLLTDWLERGERSTAPDPMVSVLQAEVATLTADRDRWRTLAKAAMPMADSKPVKRGSDPLSRHPAGPVLQSAVPGVSGTVPWCGLKSGKR